MSGLCPILFDRPVRSLDINCNANGTMIYSGLDGAFAAAHFVHDILTRRIVGLFRLNSAWEILKVSLFSGYFKALISNNI
jgi:hypothetical protein